MEVLDVLRCHVLLNLSRAWKPGHVRKDKHSILDPLYGILETLQVNRLLTLEVDMREERFDVGRCVVQSLLNRLREVVTARGLGEQMRDVFEVLRCKTMRLELLGIVTRIELG